MTRSVVTPLVRYDGSGTSGPFSFSTYVSDSSFVTVTKLDSEGNPTELVEGTDYTFAGEGTAACSVTTTDTVDTGETLVIYRQTPIEQSQNLIQGGAFSSTTQMTMADRIVDMVQEIQAQIDNFLLPLGGYGPTHATNAGRVLKLNSTGTGLETTAGVDVSAFIPGQHCLVVATSNITLSGTQTIDSVGVVATNVVLAADQTDKSENGVYVVAAGAWTRHDDYTTTDSLQAMTAFGIIAGTNYAGTIWVQLVKDPDVGTDDLVFGRWPGSASYSNVTIDTAGTLSFGSDVIFTHSTDAVAITGGQISITFNGGATAQPFRLVNSTDNASVAVLSLEGDRATMADNDEAYVSFKLSDDAGTQKEVARQTWVATDVNAGTSVDGRIDWGVMTGGTLADELSLDGSALFASTDGGLSLGKTTNGYAALHLTSGGVINAGNGEMLVTFGANAAAVTGGSISITDSTAASTAALTATNSTNNATVKGITIAGDRSAPANNDAVYAEFQLSDSAGNQTEVVRLAAIATDVANGSEDAEFRISLIEAAALVAKYKFTGTAFAPVTNDAWSLGTSALGVSDGFWASGAVQDFGAGDVQLIHSANTLTLSGGDLVLPDASAATHALNRQTADARYLRSSQIVPGIPINASIHCSVLGNNLTVAIKTAAGADPSATDPAYFPMRSATASDATITVLSVTAATSVTITSGSTLGTSSGAVPFRIRAVVFNDGGTARIGIINCLKVSGNDFNIRRLSPHELVSSTAEGGAGGADTAQIFYTGTAVTSKPYCPLGFLEWGSGITTAGTWDADATIKVTHAVGVPLPADTVNTWAMQDSATASTTTTLPLDDTVPQNTEGGQFMTMTVAAFATANVFEHDHGITLSSTNTADAVINAAMFQDSNANALITSGGARDTTANTGAFAPIRYRMRTLTTSNTTFNVRAGSAGAGTTRINGGSGTRLFGGTYYSWMRITELAT